MPANPNKFVWYELMTSDVDAAEAFYKSVVGWNSEPWGGPDMRYIIMKAGETGVAGMMATPKEAEGMKPAWVGYIYADNVDAATEGVRKGGGNVLREPDDIPDVGRFSVVADPQGAVFMLITPKGEEGAPVPPMTPGHIGWHELMATEWETAFYFYSNQFGWTKDEPMDMGPMGVYQLFRTGGDNAVGGMMTKPAQIEAPYWLYYFNVEDIDKATERALENKGQVIMGPMQVPGGSWVCQCIDPQGALFALVGARK
ncbi:hypothetical protein C7441_103140 [Pseudaminobacter salicylatoxidans]|uniref:VOC domain-containing protein n=1 Tax=Pseudaminobacter salicylatoxidans TaxID=93369 RepID=A0A316CT38_PSESE|nr:VOC family protein [Pseudaminobacter salicylatoxidans]PWJ85284.1 hypothetical protein C7441_103140 [Pseudaminobacter salicylatoxidans]